MVQAWSTVSLHKLRLRALPVILILSLSKLPAVTCPNRSSGYHSADITLSVVIENHSTSNSGIIITGLPPEIGA